MTDSPHGRIGRPAFGRPPPERRCAMDNPLIDVIVEALKGLLQGLLNLLG